ncbi:hypothetical protein GQ600_9340 [Phytophthora cactorum]|nr:hypothetical protein GQ600_9340 [Phytophthora cactorum]
MSTSTALEFGVINTLRTGNAVYDLMVCMVVPAVVQRITNSGQDALGILRTAFEFLCCLFFPRKYVTHLVETKEVLGANRTYRLDDDSKGNELLQKAILLYLTEHVDLQDKSGRYDLLERPNAKKILEEKEFVHVDLEKQKRIKALLEQPALPEVAKLGVSVLPPLDRWIKVEEGVKFMNETKKNDDEKRTTIQETKTLFHLRSNLSDGPERIDAFVEKAFAFYRDIENKKFRNDTARYMYVRSSDRPAATDTDDESKLKGVDSTPVFATVDIQETSAVDDDAGFDDARRVGQFYRRGKKAARFFGPSMMNFDDDHDDGLLSALLQSQIEFEGFGPKMKGGRLQTLEGSHRVFTPADIEELCAEHDSVDDALDQMLF